jgi:hypothetical protein
MAISARKLAANRANAKKSTGPRTAAGKRRSSKNAVTHGMFCNDTVLPGEDAELFETFRHAVLLQLSPQDIVELMLVDRIVIDQWKLRRLNAVEAMTHIASAHDRVKVMRDELAERRMKREMDEQVYGERDQGAATRDEIMEQVIRAEENEPNALQSIALSFIEDDGVMERMSRYEQRLELSIHRNLRQLEKLRKQTQRDEKEGTEPTHKRCPFVPREAYEVARKLQCDATRDDEIEETEPTADDTTVDRDARTNKEGPIAKSDPKHPDAVDPTRSDSSRNSPACRRGLNPSGCR